MKRLFPISLLAVFLLHWQIFSARSIAYWHTGPDAGDVFAGWMKTPSLIDGLARWFTGNWINEPSTALRPLSAAFHYLQIEIFVRWGYVPVIIGNVAIFALICAMSGVLAARLFDMRTGYLATVFSAGCYLGIAPHDWLGSWIVVDNLLCMAALLGALIYFDTWLKSRERRHLCFAWFYFLTACLCKEYAYIFPITAASFALYRVEKIEYSRLVRALFPMLAFVVLLAFYRSQVLPKSYDALSRGGLLDNWWLVTGFCSETWQNGIIVGVSVVAMQFLAASWGALQLLQGAILAATPFAAWKFRGVDATRAALVLLVLSSAPIYGWSLGGHRMIFVWTFAAILFSQLALKRIAALNFIEHQKAYLSAR